MAAPRDTTHSIKSCKLCGKLFDPPEGKKIAWMNIVPSRANPLVHTALCDECFESEGGVWWAKGRTSTGNDTKTNEVA